MDALGALAFHSFTYGHERVQVFTDANPSTESFKRVWGRAPLRAPRASYPDIGYTQLATQERTHFHGLGGRAGAGAVRARGSLGVRRSRSDGGHIRVLAQHTHVERHLWLG